MIAGRNLHVLRLYELNEKCKDDFVFRRRPWHLRVERFLCFLLDVSQTLCICTRDDSWAREKQPRDCHYDSE